MTNRTTFQLLYQPLKLRARDLKNGLTVTSHHWMDNLRTKQQTEKMKNDSVAPEKGEFDLIKPANKNWIVNFMA